MCIHVCMHGACMHMCMCVCLIVELQESETLSTLDLYIDINIIRIFCSSFWLLNLSTIFCLQFYVFEAMCYVALCTCSINTNLCIF